MEAGMAGAGRVRSASVPVSATPSQRSLWQEVWRHRSDYLFISPFYIIFLMFGAYPLGWALLLSFQRWRGFGEATWVGLDNYAAMFSENIVKQALINTLIFAAVLVPTGLILALSFAVLLNIRNFRARGLYRTIYFIPYITSSIIVGIVFRMLLDDSFGWANVILRDVGIAPIHWLRTPVLAKISVILLTHWHGIGYSTVILLGGLQSIPREIYESAEIDGANAWKILWKVTFPLMRPVMLFVMLVSTIGILNMFNQPYILTKGGPDAETTTLTYRLWELAFGSTRFGDAAALGFMIGALVILVTMVQLRILRNWWQ
jgi:ABC-type sugar transport system permease subunit